jgi:HEAT repeat protein
VDYLRDALQDTPSRTRLLAVDALRELGPLAASATPELKQASRDGSRKVRKAANKALAALEARPRPGDRR